MKRVGILLLSVATICLAGSCGNLNPPAEEWEVKMCEKVAVAFTLNTTAANSSRAIKIIADGQGLAATGNIVIEQSLSLSGDDGGRNTGDGGARRFGSGYGGDDAASNRDGQSAASDGYTRPGIGGGRETEVVGAEGGGGGGFGGDGGRGSGGGPAGGRSYGRLDMLDLAADGGPRAGSGGGAGNNGCGGSGGGAIQLLALNDITVEASVSITANGGIGNGGGPVMNDGEKRRGGGGGSGGAIRLVADMDGDGFGTLTYSDATLQAAGGIADSLHLTSYGGSGGGGRIVLSGASVVGGVADVSGGGSANPGADGSVLIDAKDAVLSLSGSGAAANMYTNYTSLVVTASSTLELGGADTIATLNVSNDVAVAVSIAGTLAIDYDGATVDKLSVTNELSIGSGAVLALNEVNPITGWGPYVIVDYDSRSGVFASVTGVPDGYAVAYDENSKTEIILFRPIPATLFMVR